MPEIAVQQVIELGLERHDAAGHTKQDDECCSDERDPQVDGADQTAKACVGGTERSILSRERQDDASCTPAARKDASLYVGHRQRKQNRREQPTTERKRPCED